MINNVLVKLIAVFGCFVSFPMLFRSGLTLLANGGNLAGETCGLGRHRIQDLLLFGRGKSSTGMHTGPLVVGCLLSSWIG